MPATFNSIAAATHTIHIGDNIPSLLSSFLKKHKFSSIFILVDENTLQHCLPSLIGQVKQLAEAELIELESGESHKTLDTCIGVWQALTELGADRKSLLINLGGGVITDMGGFIASAYKRGIAFINLPTTLLAQIDASAGGKTGVDLDGLKNQIGFFADPMALFIYPPFLKTLPERELNSGYAEALKHGLITDRAYWEKLCFLLPTDESAWEEIVAESVRIKLRFTETDKRESGNRKKLNFGHTIGHAVESFFLEQNQTSLLHGEAIAIGMICESFLSSKLTGLPAEELEEIGQVLMNRYKPVELDSLNDHRLIELMQHDKKNSGKNINFTLLTQIGESVIDQQTNPAEIIVALNYYRSLVHSMNHKNLHGT
jgi:3-dehydroquinate synthase